MTVALQKPDISFNDAQFLLNSIVDSHKGNVFKTANEKYLTVDARIVHSVPFHTAMLKVLEGHEDQLSVLEKNVLLKFKKPVSDLPNVDVDMNADWASSLLSKRKVSVNSKSSYLSLKFIRITSCDVERLFSVSRNILSYERQSMTPERFEQVIYLKMNKRLWDAGVISRVFAVSDDVGPDDDSNPDLLIIEDEFQELGGIYRNAAAVNMESDLIVERRRDDPEIKDQPISENVQESSEQSSIEIDSLSSISSTSIIQNQHQRRSQEIRPFERSMSFNGRMESEIAKDPRFNAAQLLPKHNVREIRPPEKYRNEILEL